MTHDHARGSVKHRGRLLAVLALTFSYMLIEATVGFVTDSLVLVADAGHMLTDVAGLAWHCSPSGSHKGRPAPG